MTQMVKYGTYTVEDAESDEKELASAKKFWKPEEGTNTVRLLPPKIGQKMFMKVWQHFVELPGKKFSVNCPRMMLNKSCPICSKADELKATGLAADRDAAYSLFARQRIFANVIDRDAEDKGPQTWGFGKKIYEQLINLRKNPKIGGDFANPEKGYDLIVERKGKTKNDTEYAVHCAREANALGDFQWIEDQADLTNLAAVKSAADIEADLTEDEGETAKSSAPGGRQARTSAAPATKVTKTAKRSAEDDVMDAEFTETDDDMKF